MRHEGLPGVDGLSAYEIACAKGYRGSVEQWLESLKGEPGRDGMDGQPGRDGRDGADADPRAIVEAVARAVQALPPPERGEKGEPGPRGEPGKDAPPPAPQQPWTAVFERQPVTRRTERVRMAANDGSAAWLLVPEYDSDDLMSRVALMPI